MDPHPISRGTRRDGWTIRRQLTFLDTLASTRSITAAARAAGMSRESAYRLRNRASAFAAAWDRTLAAPDPRPSHRCVQRPRPGSTSVKFGPAWRAQEMALLCGNVAEGHKVDEPPFSPAALVFR